MDLQDQLEIGKQAEDFLRYIEERPYFKGLLERIKLEYAKSLLSLSYDQKDQFSVLKCKSEGIDDVLEAISGDVFLGAEAFKKLSGLSEEPKGLL